MNEVITMARVGRPAKSGKRYPGGKLVIGPKADKGTDEAQARRAWLAGGDPKKDYLTTTPFDVLFANDGISADEYRVGCTYARRFGQVVRRPMPPASTGAGGGGGAPDEKAELTHEVELKRMWAVLDRLALKHGRGLKDAFDNLIIYQRAPRWMLPVIPRRRDMRDAYLFELALKAMTKAMTLPGTVKAA